jgi:hypothetical protein
MVAVTPAGRDALQTRLAIELPHIASAGADGLAG